MRQPTLPLALVGALLVTACGNDQAARDAHQTDGTATEVTDADQDAADAGDSAAETSAAGLTAGTDARGSDGGETEERPDSAGGTDGDASAATHGGDAIGEADDSRDAGDSAHRGDSVGPNCLTLAPGHRRHLVVARPYSEPNGAYTNRWEVLPLAADGTLGKVVASFEMGRAHAGHVIFRPDGALGVAPGADGTLGVFALAADGQVTVLASALDPGAYVSDVVFDGDRLLLVDGNWPENGGGIYAASLGCDGAIGPAERLYPTKLATHLVVQTGPERVRGNQHLVAAKQAVDTTLGTLHLVAEEDSGWTRLAGAALFPDDFAILSALAVTRDGRFALVGDNQAFDPADNRIGFALLAANNLTPSGIVTPLEDPYDLVASPYDDAVLVVSGLADAVRILDYDATRTPPFLDAGEVD
ncbi:MAG: hypothetical protein HYZ27_07475, partial [Deltaproteobacteria bacterium]|nr:hypothetical protein [Deltaproteobacteria bacterium]